MSPNKALIAKKLDFLNQQINSILEMEFNEEEFITSSDIHDLVTFRLQQAVETSIDIATHIIAQLNLTRKDTAKDSFLMLGEQKIIDPDLSFKMGQAADFRNRVVHGYNDFDFHLLFKDYRQNLNDLKEFGKQILNYLQTQ